MTQPRPSIADYWVGPSVWLQSPIEYAEGSVAFVGVVLWPAGIDPGSTQTAVMVLGPGGAQITVPAAFTGPPGLSPDLRNINYTAVPYGDALPSPAASFVPVIPGGNGVAPVYDMNLAVQQGAPGESGDFSIAEAQDFSGTLANLNTVAWNAGTSKFNPQALPFSAFYNVTGIAATGTSAGNVRTLAPMTVPPQPTAYVPVVFAAVEVAGTINTQVDLVARLGGSANSQSGVEIARGFGRLNVTSDAPGIYATFAGGLLADGFGRVAENTSQQFFLNCEEQQATPDTYSTGRAGFAIGCLSVV